MDSRRVAATTRWVLAFCALAGIVLVYREWLHVNPTTVAMTLLLFILVVAARSTLRHAVVLSLAAAICYNYFFLPPLGTFTISDPQNWLALFAFVATSVIGSRLSQRAKDEANEAKKRQHEVELLFNLSREVLQIDNVAAVVNTLPFIVRDVTRAERVVLFLLEGDRIYDADLQMRTLPDVASLRQLALSLPRPEATSGGEVNVPLHAGARPRGLMNISGAALSLESYQAIGGLTSLSLDRAQALENAARSEASKESERLRTLILDSITHELRTPLTSIKGAASALLTGPHVGESDRMELLTIIDEEADRLNHLVGQAVEMAQIEAHEVHMTFAPVPVSELLERAQAACPQVWNKHPLQVNIVPDHRVIADPEMMTKVLCNLLENAAKYSADGSPIVVSSEAKAGTISLSIADRGVGIEAAEQSLIFDRLYRAPSQAGITSGTGMGLAISRAIIDAHHGTVELTSQLGYGSVFTIKLPLASQGLPSGTKTRPGV